MDKFKDISAITLSKSKQPEILALKNELESLTSFLDPIVPTISNRLYIIRNQIQEIPLCPQCDSYCGFNKENSNKGFNKFCSDKCAKQYGRLNESALVKLKDRDWLYEQRITNLLDYDTIGGILGCSQVPVREWCKRHNIPQIDLKKVNPVGESLLENRDWMFEKHVTEHLKCEEIAELTNSSKATVSRYLEIHGITANNSNSYDRSFTDTSAPCQEVVNFIGSFYCGEIQTNNRSILNGLELDIFLPELNLAFEYNGIHHHYERELEQSFAKRKGKDYHNTKTSLSEVKNVRLMHIWSCDWESRKDILKSMIRNRIGYTENRLYARKLRISEVNNTDARNFLNENHLQGYSSSSIRYGLYDGDKLVSMMTFGKPRWNKKNDWELIRFVNVLNTSVVGAFSKLLKHFRKNHSGSIVSYADRTWSNGGVYLKNGFTLESINKPTYYYTSKDNGWQLEHKMKYRMKDEKNTMSNNGYFKVWDCGSMTLILK